MTNGWSAGVLVMLLAAGMTVPAAADNRAVRTELESAYTRMERAMSARDLPASLAAMTPDYSEKPLIGKIVKRPQVEASRKQSFEAAKSIQATFRIQSVAVTGGKAVATVRFRTAIVTQPEMDQGRTHEVVATGPFKQTWVRTAQGWRMQRSEELKGATLTLDGKPQTIHR